MRQLGLIACLAAVAGCGGSDVETVPTVPAGGTATYEGKPLQDYKIHFNDGGDRSATGMVGADGRFVLGTNTLDDGAPPGKHKVWLVYQPYVPVEAGKEEEAVIPPPKVKLPAKYSSPDASGITIEVPEGGSTDLKIELP